MYKLFPIEPLSGAAPACVQNATNGAVIPFDPANTDYANFKAQILADEAQLEDADGVLMSPEEAKAFVKELP